VSAGDGPLTIEPRGRTPQIAYLAAFVEVPEWTKLGVEVEASQAFELWIDDQSIARRDAPGDGSKSGTAKLEEGKHRILVKTVYVPGDSAGDWTFAAHLSVAEGKPAPATSTDPERGLTIHDIVDGPSIADINVSPDGELVGVALRTRRPPDGDSDNWIEIRRVKDGKLVNTLRDFSGSNWMWAPEGHRISYVTRDGGKATLRLLDIDTGATSTIVEGVKDFSNYQWSPDGSFVAYAVNVEPEENKTGVQRLRRIADRRAGDRDLSSVYIASVPAGMTRRLTAGEHSVSVHDISPDGKRILIDRSHETPLERPYTVSDLYILDVDTNEAKHLVTTPWLGRARWSPDGKRIAVTAGPSSFGGVGKNVPEGRIPNDYDGQAFLLDPETGAVDPITKEFAPSVQSVYWPRGGKKIFLVAGEAEYIRLFRYDLGKRAFKRIDIDCDVIRSRDVADDGSVALVAGPSANRPPRVFVVDLAKGRAREFMDPTAGRFAHVKIGDVETWDFTTSGGTEIVGRIHLPPDFDPSRKWPCIVYYYGGTVPVTRDFGGRYPKNLWAAHGYVVYVLQPSGATGFGQEFSSRHVNDWGKVVSEEIIEGVGKFLDAHDYVDRDRVGCIGASFGGFMTELLVTKTDIFAAAISHAGISMISSYWGEGYWGYDYNAVSAANSFPWNRPDIYIDQSPLFGVENVKTPLLLLHGSSDHNVPPGESEQMYTALKLLGKEVEYIRVEGQDHWILDYQKRLVWNDAIIAWFDRWLKDEADWWNDMYPPLEKGDNK